MAGLLQRWSLLILTAVVWCGCSTTPTKTLFVPGNPSANTALIYVYRPHGESAGFNRSYFVGVNGRKVADLEHGSFHSIEVSPGPVSFISDLNRTWGSMPSLIGSPVMAQPGSAMLEFKAEAGRVYYVRMQTEAMLTHLAPKLDLISPETATAQLIDCRRLVARW